MTLPPTVTSSFPPTLLAQTSHKSTVRQLLTPYHFQPHIRPQMGLPDSKPEEAFESTKPVSLLQSLNPSFPFSSKAGKLKPKLQALVLSWACPLQPAVLVIAAHCPTYCISVPPPRHTSGSSLPTATLKFPSPFLQWAVLSSELHLSAVRPRAALSPREWP